MGKPNQKNLPDIKPQTPKAALDRTNCAEISKRIPLAEACVAVGMSPTFVRRICGPKKELGAQDVLMLLDQDSFRETIVPRSMVIDYLFTHMKKAQETRVPFEENQKYTLFHGNVLDELAKFGSASIKCVVTSPPYWGMRIYDQHRPVNWSDSETSVYGHEQTPEGYIRHTTEVLLALHRVLTKDGSVWWNIMDTFNTRTQIRSNAVEALRAMQGKDKRSWLDHECRRYSAGHSFLKDGEQCLIPFRIAERASQIGFYVKSIITWDKTSSMPEPQESRVSRNLEYILHLTKIRAPMFDKSAYRLLPTVLGGRNPQLESDKLSDVWTLPTSSGRDGHGAQFPIALPGRCIALSSQEKDIILDPFVGVGNSGIAAVALGRRFVGIDVCNEYLCTAEKRIRSASSLPGNIGFTSEQNGQLLSPEILR